MSKLTKRITAILLSGMLVIGSASGGVYAAAADVDPGLTSEISEEVFTEEETAETTEAPAEFNQASEISEEMVTEEPVETSEAPAESAQTSEVAEEVFPEEGTAENTEVPVAPDQVSEEAPQEEAVTSYTVTLDANGGYFVNELDDSIGDYVEQAEVVVKQIPVGGAVAAVPVYSDQDGQGMAFAGWSLERDGEIVSTGGEEYAPVESCVLYAAWKTPETAAEPDEVIWEEVAEQEVDDEDTEQIDAAQETKEVEDKAGNVIATEEGPVVEDTSSETNTALKTENEQDFASGQEAVYADKDIENTNGILSDTSVPEEETQPELIESSEEEETVSEDTANGVVASGMCGENITWTLDDAGTLNISGMGNMKDYELGDDWWDASAVKVVVIEDGVTSIGNSAFYKCSNLTNITIPESVTDIGSGAFHDCKSLTNVSIPEGVTNLNGSLFSGCSNLVSVTIPKSVKIFGSKVFEYCSSLQNVIIPDGVIRIRDNSFFMCSNLKSVTIPDSVISIGKYAFFQCTNLTSVNIPERVTSIGENAFYECSSLKKITLPDSVDDLGYGAFNRCSSLESVTIPKNLTEIIHYTFYGCSSLTSVTIPDSVTSIGEGAFSRCSSLTNVIISDNVTYMGHDTFSNCYSLTSAKIPDGMTSIADNTFSGCSSLESVIIPDSVTGIGTGAFWGCSSLTSVIIPDDVTDIGAGAFSGCSSLKNVTISHNVTNIESGAFSNCSSLTNISIPNSLTNIADNTFYGCSKLTNVVIPDNVSIIDEYAFSECNSLTSLTIPAGMINIGKSAFSNCDSLSDVHYGGTRDEWESISIQAGNESLKNATLHLPPLNVTLVGDQIREVYPGQEVVLEVNASSGSQIHYQWFEDEYDCEIDGEISNRCTVSSHYDADFSCHVTDDEGNEAICTFSLKVITVENHLQAYASEWGEDAKVVAVYVDPKETAKLEVTALADEMDGLTYTWYDQDNKRIQGAEESIYQTGQLIKNGPILCEVKDKYYNVESVYFNIYIDNHLIAYPEADENQLDYSDIYAASGDNVNLNVVVEASDMEGIQYQWLDDHYKEISGATDTNYSVKNVKEFTYLIFRAIDKYGNKKQVYFYIWIKNPISNAEMVFSKRTLTYNGKAQKPLVSVFYDGEEILDGDDYTVSYKNNKNAGTATVIISGKGNYTGTKTATFKINKASQSITAKAAASRIAVGKTTTVSIIGNKGARSFRSSNTTIATVDSMTGKVTAKKVGTVKITATSAATANYNAASKTVTIKVVPAATASLKADNQATGIKLTWKKVTGANGYKVYRGSTLIKTITSVNTVTFADTKANTNGTKYTYKVVAKAATGDSTLSKSVAVFRVARPAISSVTNSAASKMTVKWGKNAKATGYQIQYSTDKSFKSGNKAVTVAGASSVSKVIGNLTKSKTYYVRIRSYKKVGNRYYWSAWSPAKTVKITK